MSGRLAATQDYQELASPQRLLKTAINNHQLVDLHTNILGLGRCRVRIAIYSLLGKGRQHRVLLCCTSLFSQTRTKSIDTSGSFVHSQEMLLQRYISPLLSHHTHFRFLMVMQIPLLL